MRKFVGTILVLLLMVVPGSLQASPKSHKKSAAKEVTLTGEVVDVSCYLAQGAKGESHKECAEACAKAGGALGILTKSGKLYVSVMPDDHKAGPDALLMDHIAETVSVKGFVRAKGGVNGIMISTVMAGK